ncbi:MAG: hypothetical protein JXA52_01330 [Planctomycetes bacterium]|nr:hypothetical protein [Planctomycetota bacterium]
MLPMVKKKPGKHHKRLSTEELGDLLGCSKNAIVHQAKKFHWKKAQQCNSRGQLVTTYSMAEVKKVYPELEKSRQNPAEKAVSKTPSNDYETPELVEAVQAMVREYVDIQRLTIEAQEIAVQRIVKVFAANIGLMLLLTITAGMTFWQWHNAEISNLQQLQARQAPVISARAENFAVLGQDFQRLRADQTPGESAEESHLTNVAMGEFDDEITAETWPKE